MSLPELQDWDRTASGLHMGARLLGVIQRLTQDPQPAHLELALAVEPQGLSSGQLPAGGRVSLDFSSGSLVYTAHGQAPIPFPLDGHSQAEVFHWLFGFLADGELEKVMPLGADLFERVSSGIAARDERSPALQRSTLLDETPVKLNLKTGRDYWSSFQEIFTGIARFKARLRGMQTPLVVWPHGFDLSTLWFAGAEIGESRYHMNFGFSPRSQGIDSPYLYAYAYPYPAHFVPPGLPAGACWHTRGWTGALLPYAEIAARPDAAAYVEASCSVIYQALLTAGS